MKIQATTVRRPGFTLVELLVVITIIAVLAGMGFAGASAAINRAKKVQALNVCASLTQALISFYDEYGALPDPSGSATTDDKVDIATNSSDGAKLINILMGNEAQSADMQNPKQIRFFQAKEAKGRKAGVEYQGNTVVALWDPWGKSVDDNREGCYYICLDTNYDEKMKDPLNSSAATDIRGQRALVYTKGRDGNVSASGKRDDVKSW